MEWLESDGYGGFAMGTTGGIPTRRYHSLLTAAVGSPATRINLCNSVHVEVQYQGASHILSSFIFSPGHLTDDGLARIRAFSSRPWPIWIFALDDDIEIRSEILIAKNPPLTMLRWTLNKSVPGIKLRVKPLLSGRDYHSLHHENPSFKFEYQLDGQLVTFKSYDAVPAISMLSNAQVEPLHDWFRGLWYQDDKDRGSEFLEDLAVPALFTFDFNGNMAVLIMSAESYNPKLPPVDAVDLFRIHAAREFRRRINLGGVLENSAEDYVVKRSTGKTIIAGYPWFADWGRDTFISMRGLCLTTGRLSDAESILVQWSETVSEGMLPNRFLEHGESAEYNSVDASLWYIIAAYEFLQITNKTRFKMAKQHEDAILRTIDLILTKFISGTRYNIKCDPKDGLLSAGELGVQLTWMDAKVGDYVVTPRIGKPVEIQALWINALKISGELFGKNTDVFDTASASFEPLFWNHERQCLFDVCDVNHNAGSHDGSMRPNQIFAVGGLPFQVLKGEKAKKVVTAAEQFLLTPYGLRSLAATEEGYRNRYVGNAYDRDTAYHQGTVWPWLMGAFIEAWLRVNGSDSNNRQVAQTKYLKPFLRSLEESGVGHISEIHDAEFPFVHRGCPFQAWSLGEAIRVRQLLNG